MSRGYKKPLNEQLFNDEGEQMMSYRQYQDYNKPLERDYEDMYNDEEEDDNDNDYYIDAPIGRRLKDGTMIKFRDDDDVEFGGEILDMVHYDEDEPKYQILPHGDRYDTFRYPHEVKIDKSFSPRLSEQRSKKSSLLNEEVSKEEIINHFGFQKKFEKTLDNGSVIEGFSGPDNVYAVNIVIMGDKAKILYRGPVFGSPDKKTESDLTIQFFQKDWIPVSGGDMFPMGIQKAFKHAELIKKYNNSESLR
jgi:hypothetical protein